MDLPSGASPLFARIIWSGEGLARNQLLLFRRDLDLSGPVRAATLHLWADLRYRLRIDGRIVHHGISLQQPSHPVYDSIDLLPWLGAGRHRLVVEVWHPGTATFHASPRSRGGMCAWGDISLGDGTWVDLATPGAWLVRAADDLDPWAQAATFAQGPVEVSVVAKRQAALVGEQGWTEPVAVTDGPWGAFVPRDLGPLTTGMLFPDRCAIHPLADREQVVGVPVLQPGVQMGSKGKRAPYAGWIHAEQATSVEMSLFWGPHALNGVELECRNDTLRGVGACQRTTLNLRPGWNLLYGEPEVFGEVWPLMFGLPRGSGLCLRPTPDVAASEGILVAPLRNGQSTTFPVDAAALAALGLAWQAHGFAEVAPFPARCMAWDEGLLPMPASVGEIVLPADRPSAVLADFTYERSGRIRLTIDTPAGAVVDVASHEILRHDGLVDVGFRPFVDLADRYVVGAGRSVIEGFHVRAGRYVQVTVRPKPGGQGSIRVLGLGLAEARYDLAVSGSFCCDEPLFDWTMEACTTTLLPCLEDSPIDPHRERGLYLADAYMAGLALRAFSRDTRLERHTLALFAQGRISEGAMPAVTPSSHPGQDHSVFAQIWVVWLHSYWQGTGDIALVQEHWQAVEGIVAATAAPVAPSGLWNGKIWADWGQITAHQDCLENATLNAYRYAAIQAATALAKVLGYADQARHWRELAGRVRTAMCERLWDAQAGGFAAGIDAQGRQIPTGSVHADLVALAYGCHRDEHIQPLLLRVEAALADNVERCRKHLPGRIELYFLVYALTALYRHGRTAAAESVLRSHLEVLRASGDATLPEILFPLPLTKSHCHVWSCHPAWFFHTRILGVRPAQDGDPNRIVIAPETATLHRAAGVVPHPAGLIEVAWEVQGDVLRLSYRLPPGVVLAGIVPAGALAGLRLLVEA